MYDGERRSAKLARENLSTCRTIEHTTLAASARPASVRVKDARDFGRVLLLADGSSCVADHDLGLVVLGVTDDCDMKLEIEAGYVCWQAYACLDSKLVVTVSQSNNDNGPGGTPDGDGEARLYTWCVETGARLGRHRLSHECYAIVECAGRIVVSDERGVYTVLKHSYGHDIVQECTFCDFTRSTAWFLASHGSVLVASTLKNIMAWDISSRRCVARMPLCGSNRATGATRGGDGSGSGSSAARISMGLGTTVGSVPGELEPMVNVDDLYRIDIDAKHVIAASNRGGCELRVYSREDNYKLLHIITGAFSQNLTQPVVKLISNGMCLLGSGADRAVFLFSLSSGHVLYRIQLSQAEMITSINVTKEAQLLLATSAGVLLVQAAKRSTLRRALEDDVMRTYGKRFNGTLLHLKTIGIALGCAILGLALGRKLAGMTVCGEDEQAEEEEEKEFKC